MADFLSIMPLVNTITGIPISFGGVGVRETLFQTLLEQLAHVPAGLALKRHLATRFKRRGSGRRDRLPIHPLKEDNGR